jgi:RNA polymerase sigma-70 factor, ECF subfamily
MSRDPEARLIARCRRGDADAWNELFDLYYAPTGRFICQLSPELAAEDVEEVCQEVFLSVVRHLKSFHRKSRLRTWIYRIAVNKARDYHQKHCAVKRGGGRVPESLQATDPETGLSLDLPCPDPAPDARLVQTETAQMIGEALAKLGEPWRELIELRYFGGLSYEEIAVELNLKPGTVSSRLSKALDRLEGLLRRFFAEDQFAPDPAALVPA